MPRNALFTREEVVGKAFDLVREKGSDALSARELGKALGSSSRPIFTLFKNMEELKEEVRKAASDFLASYMEGVTDYTPAFKEYARRLIRFSKEEDHLFTLLFLSREARRNTLDHVATICSDALEEAYGLSHDEMMTLLNQCWTFICGMTILSNTGAVDYDDGRVSEMLSRQFISNLMLIKSGKELPVVDPHLRGEGEEEITLKIDF